MGDIDLSLITLVVLVVVSIVVLVAIFRRPKSDKLAPKVIQSVTDGRSYRWIARDLGINKNTVLEIMKRHRENAL